MRLPAILVAAVLLSVTALAQRPARDAVRPTASGVIRGHVRSLDGTPLRKALVSSGSGGSNARAVYTDDDGRYELTRLGPGRYVVTAAKNRYVTGSPGQSRPGATSALIELAAGQTIDPLDITLWPAAAITGRMIDEYGDPVPGAAVVALTRRTVRGVEELGIAGAILGGRAVTDDEGRYRLFGLGPGRYAVIATVPRQGVVAINGVVSTSDDRSGYAPTYYPGTPDAGAATFLELNTGATLEGIDVVLRATRVARVAGTAVDSQGNPLTQAQVMLRQRDIAAVPGLPPMMAIVRDGTFFIDSVPPGTYLVEATLRQGSEITERSVEPITVSGSDIDGLQLRTLPPSTLRGRFVLKGRIPSGLRTSSLRPLALSSDRTTPLPRQAEVHDDLTFELPLFAGTYDLSALTNTRETAVSGIRIDGTDVLDRSIVVGPGRDVTGVEIELTDRPTEISGDLIAEAGTPAPFVLIVFSRDPTLRGRPLRSSMARPNQDGHYAAAGLLPGDYFAVAVEAPPAGGYQNPAFLEGIEPQATSFSLAPGERVVVNLPLARTPEEP